MTEHSKLTTGAPRPTLATLDRMVEVLFAFAPDKPSWKLQEIAQQLGWDKATSHRFLAKLTDLRFLERDSESNYALGPLIMDLSALYMSVNPVRQRLGGLMAELRDLTGLTTQVGYLSRGEVVIAMSEEGNTMVKASAALGASLPLHVTAIGKVILAQLDQETLDAMTALDVVTMTSVAKASRERLLLEVGTVKRTGIAWARSELEEGLDALAIALPTAIFGVPAGIGCSGPSGALNDRDGLEQALRKVAADIRLR